jgi:hypothetical protein
MHHAPEGFDLFRRVIDVWKIRRDPAEALTLNQIASLALGSGTAQNAAKVGRTITGFGKYFQSPSQNGYKWRVNWTRINEDHPQFLAPPTKILSPLAAMKQALDDEIRAVRSEMLKKPILALGAVDFDVSGDGSFLYEAVLDLQDDADFPMPEGVKIRLRWAGTIQLIVEGTLLSYDQLTSRIIFEVARPLEARQKTTPFTVLPCVDELLLIVKAKLETLEQHKEALSWRVLNDGARPRTAATSAVFEASDVDESQRQAIRAALTQDLTFIWGPPGTGKTHTLARLIAIAALSGKRVIATSIANVAVDQLAKRVVLALQSSGPAGERLLNEGRVLRFGHARLPEVLGERRLFPDKADAQQLRKALREARERHRRLPERDAHARALVQKQINDISAALRAVTKNAIDRASVVLTTAVQVCMEPAFSESRFDMMVVDEASMMPIPYAMCMGMFGQAHFVVAGDFRQLGPIAISQTKHALDWLHKDLFSLTGISATANHPALQMLIVQRRMHPDVCALVNGPFYLGKLKTATSSSTTQASSLPPLKGQSVTLVELLSRDGSAVEQTSGHSRVNPRSAEVTTALVQRLLGSDPSAEIGVVTPYRGQVSEIKRRLKELDLPREQHQRVKVGTVHAFQGSEADVIVWDIVDTREFRVGRLYQGDSGDRLCNVAISRAKGKLIIVGDPDAFLFAPGKEMVKQTRNILAREFVAGRRNRISAAEVLPSARR